MSAPGSKNGHRPPDLSGPKSANNGNGRFLFDHLVGARKQRRRKFEAKRLCRLEVNYQLKPGWLFDGQIARVCSV